MGIMALVFCLVAFLERKANRKTARMYMSGAIVAYVSGILISWVRVAANPSSYRFNGIGFMINATILTLMIVARVNLNSEPKNTVRGTSFKPSRSGRNTSNNSIDYKGLSKEIFDVCLEFTNLTGNRMAMSGADRFSMNTIQTATLYGTSLYEWSILLLREKMHKIYTNKVEFETEDNKMIEIFARKIQMPVSALLKIVDRNGGIKDWETILLMENSVPMKDYMDEIRVIVNRATRRLIGEHELEDLGGYEELYNDENAESTEEEDDWGDDL